jgi:hypothetical protein
VSFEKSLFCEEPEDWDEDRENPKCEHGIRWSHYYNCKTCCAKKGSALPLTHPENPWHPPTTEGS